MVKVLVSDYDNTFYTTDIDIALFFACSSNMNEDAEIQVVSYDGLEKALKDKHIGKTELATRLGLSSRTVAKIGKGEKLSNRSIERIAGYLGVAPDLLMKEVSDNSILQLLREEKELKLPGGLYHEMLVRG